MGRLVTCLLPTWLAEQVRRDSRVSFFNAASFSTPAFVKWLLSA